MAKKTILAREMRDRLLAKLTDAPSESEIADWMLTRPDLADANRGVQLRAYAAYKKSQK